MLRATDVVGRGHQAREMVEALVEHDPDVHLETFSTIEAVLSQLSLSVFLFGAVVVYQVSQLCWV
jgi:hypothetical protein